MSGGRNGHRPRSSYLEYLPGLYRDDDFMGQFLLIFESVLGPIENMVDNLALYFDPRLAPESLLPWRAGATEIRNAATPAERARLWAGRKKAFGAMGRLTRDLVVQDAVVPRSALPDVLDQVATIAARHQVTVVSVFHAGDGNLHPNLCYDRADAGLVERVRLASREIMAACIAAGGSITGEHGVGSDKLEYMPLLFDDTTLTEMCDIREVFDPDGRANTGKVVPVRSCREWRAGGAR